MSRRLLPILAAAGLLAACQAYPGASPAPGETMAVLAAPRPGDVLLRGQVDFGPRRVLATEAEVAKSATVSLIDSSGVTRAAGITDTSGAFTLFHGTVPFQPTNGEYFTLEVSRREGGQAGSPALSLRTVVKHTTGSPFTSITGTTIKINATTTAIVLIDLEDAAIGASDLMGIVSGTTVSNFGSYTASDVTSRATSITNALSSGTDPLAPKVYNDGNLTISSTTAAKDRADIDVVENDLIIEYFDVPKPVYRVMATTVTVNLPRLKKVGGTLTVRNCSTLTTLSGLSALTSVGSLVIEGNGSLADLAGLEKLKNLTSLTITDNCVLTNAVAQTYANATGRMSSQALAFRVPTDPEAWKPRRTAQSSVTIDGNDGCE